MGLVGDTVAELDAAAVVVVPIWQVGRTRVKVPEALGPARPAVGTTLGVSGIGVADGVHALVADTPQDFAAATGRLLADHAAALEPGAAERRLAERFRWRTVTAPTEELYARLAAAGPSAVASSLRYSAS